MTARLLAAYRAWRINRHAERQEARDYYADEMVGHPGAFGRADLAVHDQAAADLAADQWRYWE